MSGLRLSPVQRFLAGACLAILLAGGLLGYGYLQSRAQKAELTDRLAALQATVQEINADGGADAAANPPFPANPPNLALASLVLNSAAASGVTTTPLQAATLGREKVGTNTYQKVTLAVTVSGTLPQILDFFDRVERGNIKTLTFDNLHLESAAGRWTAEVQVIAYAQAG